MKVILIILFFLSFINFSNSQSRSYRYYNFIEHKSIFIEAHAGVSIGGNETVNTGFYEKNENKSQVKISTNSGSLVKPSK